MSTKEIQTKVLQRILQNNWTDLQEKIILDPILPSLFRDKLIGFDFKVKLQRITCPGEAVQAFLDRLYKFATEEKIRAFIEVLDENPNCDPHKQMAAKLRSELSTESDLVINSKERCSLRSQTENTPEEMEQEESTGSEGDSTDSSESHEAANTTTRRKRNTRSYKGGISSSPSTESDGENDNNYERDGFVVSDSPVDSDSGEPDESASDSVESDMDHRKPIKRSQTENKPEEMQQEESTGSEGDSTDSSKSHEAGSTTTRKKRRTRSYKGDISSSPGTESDGENDNNYEQDGFIVCDSPVDSDSGEPDESASDSVESDMDHRKPIKSDLEIGKENMSSSTRKSERIRSSKTHRKPFKDLNGVGKAVEHSNSWITSVKPFPSPYVPQLADRVHFIPKAYKKYEEKLKELVNEKHLCCEPLKFAPKLRNRNILCVVENIGYKMAAETVAIFILHLRNTTDGSLMKIRYCNLRDVADFLVLAEHYDVAMKQTWTPGIGFCTYLDGDWVFGTVVTHSAHKSHFEIYKVLIEGCAYYLSPWEMFTPSSKKCMEKNLDLKEVLNDITHLWEREEFSDFLEDVTLTEYQKSIPIPMCLARIRDRIINSYYRTVQSLIFDLRLIYLNALAFNDESHPVGRKLVRNAHTIVHRLYQMVTSNTDAEDEQEFNSQEILDEESFLKKYPAEFQPVGFSTKKPERNRVQNRKHIPAKRAKFLDSDEDSS